MFCLFLPQLLTKAVIRRAAGMSAAAFTAEATAIFNHNEYVIRVLEAPIGVRIQVRDKAIVLAEATDSESQKRLVCVLTMFEILPPAKQAEFIRAFKACATVVTQGEMAVVRDHTFDDDHIPPRSEP